MEQTIDKLLAAQQSLAEARKEIDPRTIEYWDICQAMKNINYAITTIEARAMVGVGA